jgi:(2Fe-2S) ferredoxin
MCTAHGSDEIHQKAAQQIEKLQDSSDLEPDQNRLLRGGCFGLCELAPNAVLREWPSKKEQPDPDTDRLVLLGTPNETVYCTLKLDDVPDLVQGHLAAGQVQERLTRTAREAARPPRSKTAERIRALRERARNRPR